MIRISSLILLVTFFRFPKYTCEENDKFIHRGHMIFVGGELVGGITILKSAVYKRGHIKLRCCSECLREVDCSGIRIDFNSSSCALLRSQFSALEQSLSSSQIFMFTLNLQLITDCSQITADGGMRTCVCRKKTGTATVTTSTMQMSSIAESSSKTTPVTVYETTISPGYADETASTHFVTEIASTEAMNETTSPDTVTETTPSVIVSETTTPETLNETSFLETTFPETVTDTFQENEPETTSPDIVNETTVLDSLTETTSFDSVKETAFPETVTETTFPKTVTETTSPDNEPETTSPDAVNITFPDTVNETTSSNTMTITTSSDSVKEITFHDTDTLSPHTVTEKTSPKTVTETTSPDPVTETSQNTMTETTFQDTVTVITSQDNVTETTSQDTVTEATSEILTEITSAKNVYKTSSSDILNKTTFLETVAETTPPDTEPGTTFPDILNETTSLDTVTETTSSDTVAETLYSDTVTFPITVNKTTPGAVTETTSLGTELDTTLMGFPSTIVALVTSTERVCSNCECIGITTSQSGVYEITVDGSLTNVYCEMAYGIYWTVVFRRTVGNVIFNNAWTSYTNGFGNLDGDFWLGLDHIHHFTSSGQSVMTVEMEDINGKTGFAQYSTFLVGSPSSGYKLTVSQYAGNSGYDAFFYHNDMKFSTKDRDNDLSSSINCAGNYGEPWWNNDCSRMIFTRNNFNELGWYNWYTGSYKQLSKIRMMIRKPLIVETSGCSDCDCVGSLTTESGVYEITADGNPLQVYCEMNDGFNWMVILRRIKGDVLFNNIWTSYENGFGNLDGDFWQGLKHINKFSAAGWSVMRVEMEDIVGYYGYAQYSTFQVGNAASEYRLTISGYSGTSGYDAFSYHNGQKFSTKDVDNDLSAMNCAVEYGSPWWNNDCGRVKFTLNDFKALGWYNWHTGSYRPLVRVKMAIRK